MNTPPTITIVTPSYNQAAYLERTLLSVISQRDHVHEYFVLDGGSTDGSRELIQKHAAHIDYWVSEKDGGQSAAIDAGFARATGDIVFWLNSDDLLLPGAVARVREAFAAHPTWDVLTGWSVFVDADDIITRVNTVPGESRAWARHGILHVCQQTCYFRRSLYERVGGLDRSLHCSMDVDLWLKFFEHGATWGHVPNLLGGFRLHELMKGRTLEERYERERHVVAARYPWFPTRLPAVSPARLAYRATRAWGLLSPRQRKLLRLVGKPVRAIES